MPPANACSRTVGALQGQGCCGHGWPRCCWPCLLLMDGTTVGPLHAMPPWHLAMVLHKPILALLGVVQKDLFFVPRRSLDVSLATARATDVFRVRSLRDLQR